MEVYKQLKDEYFGFVRQAGELDLQLKEMEVLVTSQWIVSTPASILDSQEDLNSARNALGRMERELWAAEDQNGPRKRSANTWQVKIIFVTKRFLIISKVGVPYGSGRSGRQ